MSGFFFNEYPYTDFHELNLSWIIKKIIELNETVKNFVSLNAIKYADPIQWNIASQYEKNTVVVDPQTGTAYISVAPVPSGVALSNPDYWTPIFDLDIAQANNNITLRDDGNNILSTFSSDAGDWLLWNGILYRVTQPISTAQAYVPGYNIERYTVELFIKDYITELSIVIGDLNNLNTSDKTSIVNAINSVLPLIGDLDDLSTTDKTSIVNALNEVLSKLMQYTLFVIPEMYGGVGDGVTDDTQAFNDAFHSGYPVKLMPNKTYKVGVVDLSDIDRIFLDGNESIIKGATFHVNVNIGGTHWNTPYAWESVISNVHFIADSSEVGLHIGGGLIMNKCVMDDYDTFIQYTLDYVDDCKLVDCGFRNYNRGANVPKIIMDMGDLVWLERVHVTGVSTYMSNYVLETRYTNAGTAKECISCGVHLKASSVFEISDSLYNKSYNGRITANNESSIVTCRNCAFVGTRYISLNTNVRYVDCTFRESLLSGGNNGISIEQFAKWCEHCNIVISRNVNNALSDDNVFNSDNLNWNNFSYTLSAASYVADSGNVVDGDPAYINGLPETGTYTYYVFPSMYADRIIRTKTEYASDGLSMTANAGQCFFFRNNHGFDPCYKHVYRVSPSNTIHKAVIPPSSYDSLYGAYLLDNGTLNGFKWETVSALPTITASNETMKNGIVSAYNANIPSGSIYIDTSDNSRLKQRA